MQQKEHTNKFCARNTCLQKISDVPASGRSRILSGAYEGVPTEGANTALTFQRESPFWSVLLDCKRALTI